MVTVLRVYTLYFTTSSYLFATTYMQEGLPEHVYNYIKTKSNTFFRELIEQYERNEDLKNYLSGNK